MFKNNIDELIGKTPLLKLNNFILKYNLEADIFAKLEYFNPAGSVKDRVAKAMLDDAEQKNLINKESVIIEPTSGNTGIGLSSICASRGYKLILTMPETMSIERRKLLKAYGAEIVLTEGDKGMKGAIEKAEALNKEIPNSIILGQFINPSNPKVHYATTGPEIWEDMDGNIDIFVGTVGTGGTLSGTGNFLKSKNNEIKIVAVEPQSSNILSGGKAGAHKIQGIGAGFVPLNLDTSVYDEIITVTDEDAFFYLSEICKSDGVLVGISSGAVLFAAKTLAERPENKNKNIVVVFPDTGERYLSTPVFSE